MKEIIKIASGTKKNSREIYLMGKLVFVFMATLIGGGLGYVVGGWLGFHYWIMAGHVRWPMWVSSPMPKVI